MSGGQFSNILIRESEYDDYDIELVFDPGTENELVYPLTDEQEEIFQNKLRDHLRAGNDITRDDAYEPSETSKRTKEDPTNAGSGVGTTLGMNSEAISFMREMAEETNELRSNLRDMKRTNQKWRKRTWAWRFLSFLGGIITGAVTSLVL